MVGAGPVGRATAAQLVLAGAEVVLASRSGVGEEVPGALRVALEAADVDAVTSAAEGARAIYNCVNPPQYHRWETQWPPVARSLLRAAELTGAVLATAGNLYPYGPVEGPMVEGMTDAADDSKGRVRAQMWAEALAAHRAGRVRAVEVRAGDYVGAGVGEGGHVPRVVPRALQGKAVRVIGDPHQPHTWTDVLDVARALVTVAGEPEAWGRVWHAPSNAPRTQAQAVTDICQAAGRPAVDVRGYPGWLLAGLASVMPTMREVRAIDHQFTRPFVMDSTAITRELGLVPTPWREVCERTAGSTGVRSPV